MKISIKLDKRTTGKTKQGFPVVVYATQNYKKKVIRTGYYAKVNEWNTNLSEPKSNHPDYYIFSDYLTHLKKRVKTLLLQSSLRAIPLIEVKEHLFKKDYPIFYNAALSVLPEGYRGSKWSAVRSFNMYRPGVLFSEISPQMVKFYIDTLLKKGNKPAGVDSYVRSLRALWNVLSNERNPFSGHKINIPPKVNTIATNEDLNKLIAANLAYTGVVGGPGQYRDYWLLMFYLGGIDPEVLAKLRYDTNVIDGRIVFNRNKGGSNVACNNIIPPAAFDILKNYNCAPYLVPIYKSKNYTAFVKNFNNRFKKVCKKLELSKELKPKTPRYTFINRAQQLLIDERVTAQIVGHKRKTTTSLYTNDFPQMVQDAAHLKIISW